MCEMLSLILKAKVGWVGGSVRQNLNLKRKPDELPRALYPFSKMTEPYWMQKQSTHAQTRKQTHNKQTGLLIMNLTS